MIERILEQIAAICAVLIENRSYRSLIPTAHEFNILKELINVLNPVKQATELLNGSKLQQLLLNSLKIALKSVKQTVALDLSAAARYQEPGLKKFLLMAIF